MQSDIMREMEQQKKQHVEEKKCVTQRVKQERTMALEQRKSQEKEFLDHIQYQYHVDRKRKMEEALRREEEIKRLEDEEKFLVDQLHTTIQREQKEVNEFRESVADPKSSTGSFRGNAKSHADLFDIYQTPKTSKHLLNTQLTHQSNKQSEKSGQKAHLKKAKRDSFIKEYKQTFASGGGQYSTKRTPD